MRIISPFKDYYDCVQKHGQDHLVYLRNPKEETFYPSNNWSTFRLTDNYFIIGFCKKIYPVIKLITDDKIKCCYNIEEVDSFIESNFKDKQIEAYKEGKNISLQWSHFHSIKNFAKFFDKKRKCEFNDNPLFIMDLGKGVKTYNCKLKDFEFYRIFDAYSAFQEIAMYLGALAVPQKEIPKISDEYLLQAKGFDKFSFRKEKNDKTR